MIDTLAGALGAANTAFDFLKRAIAARDQSKIETASADLVDKLRAVNEAALNTTQEALKLAQDMRAMDQKLAALERENREIKARSERRGRYSLVDIGGGALAYR